MRKLVSAIQTTERHKTARTAIRYFGLGVVLLIALWTVDHRRFRVQIFGFGISIEKEDTTRQDPPDLREPAKHVGRQIRKISNY